MANLTKFGVPNGTGTQAMLMPKLKYRFRALFEGLGTNSNTNTASLAAQVVTFARPQVTFDPIELPVYNSKAYIAGRPTWNAVSVTIRDDASGKASKAIAEQLQKQFDFYEQASAASAGDYKFGVKLQVLDGGNGGTLNTDADVLESWYLEGCFLTDVNYNDMDYGSNDPVTITISIRYDVATQSITGATDATAAVLGGAVAGAPTAP